MERRKKRERVWQQIKEKTAKWTENEEKMIKMKNQIKTKI